LLGAIILAVQGVYSTSFLGLPPPRVFRLAASWRK
jgi:hypothetical protein